jgi:hypothetical protein
MKRYMMFVTVAMVLFLSGVAQGVPVGSFEDFMDPGASIQNLKSYLGSDAPSSHNLMYIDPGTGTEAIVPDDGTVWHMGFFNNVPGGIEFVGFVDNDNPVSATNGLNGWLYGGHNEHIGDGLRAEDLLLVHDLLGDGIGTVSSGTWLLGIDDVLYSSNDILFGPSRIRGAVELLPVFEPIGASAILPEMVVSPVPEPATVSLLALCGGFLLKRKSKK